MILLLWIPIILAIVFPLKSKRRDSWGDRPESHIASMIVGGFCGVILLIACIVEPICNGAQVARLNTFYEINNQNYGIAVNETASYLSQDDFEQQLAAGSLEKLALAGFISERIAEWREGVNEYNLELAEYKYYDTHPFLGVLFPRIPENVKTLIIK